MNCCKLYLVPEEVINTWRAEQRAQAVDKPIHHLVMQIDDCLTNILNQEDLSDYDKQNLYSQELSKYLFMREQKMKTPPPPLRQVVGDGQFENRTLLSSIPKTFRTKAEGLLEYLKADKDIEWDDEGHIYIKQNKIEGSHILDLVHDAMRHRKKTSKPAGWQELSSHLRSKNIPKELVGNRDWWDSGIQSSGYKKGDTLPHPVVQHIKRHP